MSFEKADALKGKMKEGLFDHPVNTAVLADDAISVRNIKRYIATHCGKVTQHELIGFFKRPLVDPLNKGM